MLIFSAYIVAATVFLVLLSLQGLSHLDIGMYMAGYQYFNDNPPAVYFLAQWFFSYYLTGWLCDVFSLESFLSLRMLRVACIVLMQVAIWAYVRQHVRQRYVIAGLALATLAQADGYMDVSYNDYSCMLLVAVILLYHHALMAAHHSRAFVFVAGLLTGISFFFRIVNLTFLALPVAAWLLLRAGLPDTRRLHALFFYGGAAGGCLLVALLSLADKRLDVLQLMLGDIFSVASGSDDPHSLKSIIIAFYAICKGVLAQMGIIVLFLGAALLTARRTVGWWRAGLFLVLTALFVLNVYLWEPVGNVTVAICMLGLLAMLWLPKDAPWNCWLMGLSAFIPLVFPLGSNGGMPFLGQFLCFLTLPVAIGYLCEARFVPNMWHAAWQKVLPVAFCAVVLSFIYVQLKRPLMEDASRLECRYAIDSPLTRNVLTSRENAALHNYLLAEAKPRVPKGAYMVCNFSLLAIPLFECRPYGVLSDVFTADGMNRRYLEAAYEATGHRLPYMLFDRLAMTPGFAFVEQLLRARGNYRLAWTDGRYELWQPLFEGKN